VNKQPTQKFVLLVLLATLHAPRAINTSQVEQKETDKKVACTKRSLFNKYTTKIIPSSLRISFNHNNKLFLQTVRDKPDYEEIEQLLLHKANPNKVDKSGNIPLHYATENGHTKTVEMIIKAMKGKSRNFEIYINMHGWVSGNTPLHNVANKNYIGIATLLLEHKANPNEVDKSGCTPLHIAADKNYIDIATLLLEHNANVNVKNDCNRTPLHIAARKGHTAILKRIIENIKYKFDSLKIYLDMKDTSGFAPLHSAAHGNYKNIIVLLLKHNANVDIKDHYGGTSLHIAARRNYKTILALLLKHRANIGLQDTYGKTPLHISTEKGHTEIVRRLLDYALQNNNQKVVQLFMEKSGKNIVLQCCICLQNKEDDFRIVLQLIPCKNFHPACICKGCLPKMKACPLCRIN